MSENTATEKILGLYTLLLMSSRPWSLSMLAKKFDCSKPTMIRLLARIERIEALVLLLEQPFDPIQHSHLSLLAAPCGFLLCNDSCLQKSWFLRQPLDIKFAPVLSELVTVLR